MDAAPADEPLIPVIGYWRVSYGREHMISPDIQQSAITGWAQASGRRIVQWVGDPDNTGRHFNRRVQEAIAAIESRAAAEIGVYRYDRWGRNTAESLANVARVEDAGGRVVSVTELLDTETPAGEYNRTNAFALAQMQSKIIGTNWRDAHGSRVRAGLPADGGPRFGYVRLGRVRDPDRKNAWRRDPDDPLGERYVPGPATGPVLAALYERYAAGEAVRSLVRWLSEAGVPTASGGRWTRDTLRLVLASGFGAGLLHVHDPACRRKPERGRPCGRRVHVPGAHEAVITPGTWQAYLERAGERRGEHPRLRDPVHPLSGLLWCGPYGHRLTVTKDAGGVAYRCPRRDGARDCPGAFVRAALAEETVLAWLGQWAAGIEAAAALTAARQATVRRAQADLEALTAQKAALERQLARLMTRWARDECAEEAAYQKARAPLLDGLAAVRAGMAAATRAGKVNATAWRPIAAGLLASWPVLSPGRRRQMLGELIARIEVHRTGRGRPPRIVIVPVWEGAQGTGGPTGGLR